MKKRLFILLFYLLYINIKIYPFERYELKCPESLLLKSKEVMMNQIGNIEKTNRNDGIAIKQYLESVGLAEGYPYCAAAQYFCFLKATELLGIDKKLIPIKRTGLAVEIFIHSKKCGERGKWHPQIDDLIIWRKGNSAFGHIERIISVLPKGWVKTVGFNTSKIIDNKKVEGVFVKKRNIYHRLHAMAIQGLTGFKKYN